MGGANISGPRGRPRTCLQQQQLCLDSTECYHSGVRTGPTPSPPVNNLGVQTGPTRSPPVNNLGVPISPTGSPPVNNLGVLTGPTGSPPVNNLGVQPSLSGIPPVSLLGVRTGLSGSPPWHNPLDFTPADGDPGAGCTGPSNNNINKQSLTGRPSATWRGPVPLDGTRQSSRAVSLRPWQLRHQSTIMDLTRGHHIWSPAIMLPHITAPIRRHYIPATGRTPLVVDGFDQSLIGKLLSSMRARCAIDRLFNLDLSLVVH